MPPNAVVNLKQHGCCAFWMPNPAGRPMLPQSRSRSSDWSHRSARIGPSCQLSTLTLPVVQERPYDGMPNVADSENRMPAAYRSPMMSAGIKGTL